MGRISAYFSYVVLVLAVLAQPASAVVIKGYDSARTDGEYGLTEANLTTTLGYITDPANFGPGGISPQAYQVGGGINVATAATLAGTDVFFTGWVPTSSYTAAEKTALYNFVLGGKTLIATTDDTSHTMVDAFGLTQGDGNPEVSQITNGSHPIGREPFSDVRTYYQYGLAGHYPTLGPAGEVGSNTQGTTIAVIERGVLGPNSGAAIFVADVDVFTNDGSGGALVNQYLIKNIFAFAVPATYPRPQAAPSYRTSLVPAFKQCTTSNSTHVAPITRASCTPPELVSDELTVGTPDANGQPAKFTGYAKLTVLAGNPATPAVDEADNRLQVGLTDVRRQSNLADYTGELRLRTSLRMTDKLNGPPGTVGGTVQDFNFAVVVPCTATANTTVGSSCTLNTTLDSLTPGMVREGKRTVTHMSDVLVYDGGADGDGDTQADNTLFAWEGIFTP